MVREDSEGTVGRTDISGHPSGPWGLEQYSPSTQEGQWPSLQTAMAEDNGTPRPQPAAILHMAHGASQHSHAGQPRGVTFLPWCLGMRKHWSSTNMAWAPKRDVCLVVAVCSAWLYNAPSR